MAILLLLTVLLPIAGALLLPGDRKAARCAALAVSLAALATTIILVAAYPGGVEPFAESGVSWLSSAGATTDIRAGATAGLSSSARYTVGQANRGTQHPNSASAGVVADIRFSIALDGLSLWLFALTSLLAVVAVLIGWEAIQEQASLYYRLLLILETGMLGVFVARDIILFYVFFEFTLIPLFFLIGMWGSEHRRWAAVKFFLFTFAGSVLTFLGLLAIVLWQYYHPIGGSASAKLTFSIADLTEALRTQPMPPVVQIWIFLALFAGFAIKVPLFPLHTWLPLAHVEAPAAGSVLLAGVLLKVGTYGFARFNLPMLPDATVALMPWLLWISLCGIIYGALVSLAQSDIKRLIAYSSVSHLGFCTLGLFALTKASVQGSVLQMVNHGLSTGGLFAVVGMMYDRFHTRQIGDYSGLAKRLPVLAFFTLVLTLSSIAVPGLNGFAGEFLILLGTFQRGWAGAPVGHELEFRVIGVLGITGVILGAWYMLWMYQRVFFGPAKEPPHDPAAPPRDLSVREVCCLTPLVVLIVWIGIQPRFFLDRMAPTLDALTAPAMKTADLRSGANTRATAATVSQSGATVKSRPSPRNDEDDVAPEGPLTIAQRFIAGDGIGRIAPRPVGTTENAWRIGSSAVPTGLDALIVSPRSQQ